MSQEVKPQDQAAPAPEAKQPKPRKEGLRGMLAVHAAIHYLQLETVFQGLRQPTVAKEYWEAREKLMAEFEPSQKRVFNLCCQYLKPYEGKVPTGFVAFSAPERKSRKSKSPLEASVVEQLQAVAKAKGVDINKLVLEFAAQQLKKAS